MKIMEAFKDHTIKSVRLPRWANKEDRLELPPVLSNGHRGVWCTLIYQDVDIKVNPPRFFTAEKPMSMLMFTTDTEDYEVYERYVKGEGCEHG